MTNEPGIYMREDALDYFDLSKPEIKAFVDKIRPVFEKYRAIGVRIEDDMLVTETGVEWMTRALPRKISEIESMMERTRKEMKNVSLIRPEFQSDLCLDRIGARAVGNRHFRMAPSVMWLNRKTRLADFNDRIRP